MVRRTRFWLGIGIGLLALVLAFRQVELGKVAAAFARVDYLLVAAAAGMQLLAIGAIAWRWRLFFHRRPLFPRLIRSLLIAQLVNGVIPVRLGMLVRAYLIGREERQSKITVLTTVVAEKVFDSLGLVLFSAVVLPFFVADWFHWSSLRLSTGVFVAMLPVMVLVTHQRRRVLRLVRSAATRAPWGDRVGLVQKFEAGLEGLAGLRGWSPLVSVWVWTLAVAGLGILVNYAVLRAFGIGVPFVAAFVLFVALQIGGKVLPVAPLGGIGVFQWICVEALALFEVDRDLALSFGFMLHFVVFVPASVLGALALYRTHLSLRGLRAQVEAE